MLLYYALVCLVLVLTGPVLLLAPKRRAGIRQKLGLIPEGLKEALSGQEAPVWFHAVSVGEFNAVWPLIQIFSSKHPEHPIVISTSTQTGQNLARQKAAEKATVIYFPLDLPWAVRNWLNLLRPALVAIAETEIWPGFMHECSRRDVPVVVINGRISPRSFNSYYRWRAFFGPVIRCFRTVVAQSEADADRYRAIAGQSLNLQISGNLKFDGLLTVDQSQVENLRGKLNLRPGELVIVAGSTHEAEEAALLDVLASLRSMTVPLRLILAPRHPERWEHVASLIKSRGFRVRKHSLGQAFEESKDVYLLDSIGQLFTYYGLATVAFVGGTLTPVGGHNLLEPYAYAVPVVCGPYLEKTLDAAGGLISAEALTIAGNAEQLKLKFHELLSSKETRRQKGANGQEWLRQSQGAAGRTLLVLDTVFSRHLKV